MKRLTCAVAILTVLLNLGLAQSTQRAGVKSGNKEPATFQPASATTVTGGGTSGQISKWTGVSGSNVFTLGDSNITEDKFGKVGIGTTTPTSLLTVQGMIETTLGGYKFPDGSVQTSAFSAGQVVSSLNGLTGNVTLAAGANISITPSGKTLTIAAPNSLTTVTHDATLRGNGTNGSPLGVAIPLNLTGAVPGFSNNILTVVNSGDGGAAVHAMGGNSSSTFGGTGVEGVGGTTSSDFTPGVGVVGIGGSSNGNTNAGAGVSASGGDNNTFAGGPGVSASGGRGAILSGFGVDASGGISTSGDGGGGVRAFGGDGGFAGLGNGSGGTGVIARGGGGRGAAKSGGDGIFALGGEGNDGATIGRAGAFLGQVQINGTLNVTSTKNFKIDHPLDPENKYLYHAAIESSEVLNVYSGNMTTNENGEAIVTLPDWFEALNKDFRYQLTSIGAPALGLYIAEEINQNRFKIAGGVPGVKVSWQVTGVRSDAMMRQHPFKVEETKPDRERGTYLSPEAFGQPEEKGSEWTRNPEMMRQIKETRERALKAKRD